MLRLATDEVAAIGSPYSTALLVRLSAVSALLLIAATALLTSPGVLSFIIYIIRYIVHIVK